MVHASTIVSSILPNDCDTKGHKWFQMLCRHDFYSFIPNKVVVIKSIFGGWLRADRFKGLWYWWSFWFWCCAAGTGKIGAASGQVGRRVGVRVDVAGVAHGRSLRDAHGPHHVHVRLLRGPGKEPVDTKENDQKKRIFEREESHRAVCWLSLVPTKKKQKKQGRLDGAFCDYSESEKLEFLQEISRQNVINMEMESLAFAALTHHAGIRSAVVCVTLLNRLNGDQVATLPSAIKLDS